MMTRIYRVIIISLSKLSLFYTEAWPGRWIRRDGRILWPLRFPDVILMAFVLYSYLKQRVFHTKFANLWTSCADHGRSWFCHTSDAGTWMFYRLQMVLIKTLS